MGYAGEMVLITCGHMIDFFPSNHFCCFRYNQLELNILFIYILCSNPNLSPPRPLEGSKYFSKKPRVAVLFSTFAPLFTGTIHEVSPKRPNQVYKNVPV